MNKIPTLFLRNPENMKLVTRELNPDCDWIDDFGIPSSQFTIKKDGTNIQVIIKDGVLVHVNKRKNPSREEKALGKVPVYINADRSDPSDQYIFQSVDATDFSDWPNGEWSCEALGPNIQGGIESKFPCLYNFQNNPEYVDDHYDTNKFFKGDGSGHNFFISYDGIKDYFEKNEVEGIVINAGKSKFGSCKIKRRDFGFDWPVNK